MGRKGQLTRCRFCNDWVRIRVNRPDPGAHTLCWARAGRNLPTPSVNAVRYYTTTTRTPIYLF